MNRFTGSRFCNKKMNKNDAQIFSIVKGVKILHCSFVQEWGFIIQIIVTLCIFYQ